MPEEFKIVEVLNNRNTTSKKKSGVPLLSKKKKLAVNSDKGKEKMYKTPNYEIIEFCKSFPIEIRARILNSTKQDYKESDNEVTIKLDNNFNFKAIVIDIINEKNVYDYTLYHGDVKIISGSTLD